MVRKNLAVLFVASLIVAASAVSTADAGVGGCRALGCGGGGGWESAQAPVLPSSRLDDILGALTFFVPRPVIEGFRAYFMPIDNGKAPVQAPTSTPTIEGVGGCRGLGCGGWL